MKAAIRGLILIGLILSQAVAWAQQATPPDIPCAIFPEDHIWNTRVDTLAVDPNSDAYIDSIGRDATLHPDFGSGEYPEGSGVPIGIPYTVVDNSQPLVEIIYTDYGDESDPGPFPIPANALIEGGSDGDGDRHVLVVNSDTCMLYELYYAFPQPDGTWEASSGAVYDLNGYDLRPATWTSADAAGLPILPGLVRYEEILAGVIRHAIRFTVPETREAFIWNARHLASDNADLNVPPMGQRFRLKSSFVIDPALPKTVQIILQAMKDYGIILADNGSAMFITGVPDPRWDNDELNFLKDITADNFEAVDVCPLMLDWDSGQADPNAANSASCLSADNVE